LSRGKSFRKDYGRLYEVRSFVDCPMAVYTATVTPSIISDVKKLTGLNKNNLYTISVTPDRYLRILLN
jgi:superfamily II DNA helicase RecQ